MSNSLTSRVISSSIFRISFTILTALVAFFMLPFLAHNLGAREYGLWLIAVTLIGYYGILDLGIASAIGRFVGKAYGENNYNEINQIISTAFFIFLILGCIIFLIVTGSAFTTGWFINNSDEAALVCYTIIILGAAISMSFPLRAVNGIVYASVNHHLIIISETVKLFIKTILTIIVVLLDYGLITLAFTFAIGEVIGNLVRYFIIKFKFPILQIRLQHFTMLHLKKIFNYGWVAFIARLMVVFKLRLTPILVSSLIGVELVVIYMVAMRLMDYIHQLTSTITGIFGPIFSRIENNKDQVHNAYQYASQIMVFVTLYIGMNIAFYSKWLIPIWMGDGFEMSYTITSIFTIPFIFIGSQHISREILFGLSKHKYCAIIDTCEVIGIVLSSIILTHFYGLYGIAIGFAIPTILCEILYPFIVSKIIGVNAANTYIKTFFLPAIKISIPILIFFILADQYIEYSYWSLLISNIIEVIVLAPVVYFIIPNSIQIMVVNKLKLPFLKLSPTRS